MPYAMVQMSSGTLSGHCWTTLSGGSATPPDLESYMWTETRSFGTPRTQLDGSGR